MFLKRKNMYSIVVLLFLTSVVEPKSFALAPSKLTALREAVASFAKAEHLPGLSVVIGDKAHPIAAFNYGILSLDNPKLVQETSAFRIASVSKFVSTLAILRLLQENHHQSLDTPIDVFLRSRLGERTPDYFKHVTIDNLLTHTSGIRHYRKDAYLEEKQYHGTVSSRAKAITQNDAIFEQPAFPPGKGYRYSTYGFNMIQDIVEVISGKHFSDYLDNALFKPAGMHHTGIDDSPEGRRVDARFYVWRQGRIHQAPVVNTRWKQAGGGMVSTTLDLYRMIRHLTTGKILNQRVYQLLMERNPYRIKDCDYARGIHVFRRDTPGLKWLGHGGSATGGAAYALFREDGATILTALTNLSIPSCKLGKLLNRLSILMDPKTPKLAIDCAKHR